ncbi:MULTISPECIES: multiubiquitin domain-containing protein [Streptomyces]|uniref:multiubiquitin domain-containing protein n=1 Tax=Streptomyces TaxID=1883 RepID=UPI0037A2F3DC
MTGTHGHGARFEIQIDRVHYTVREPELTGAQLRALVSPPVPADRDLYEVRPGGEDLLVADGQAVPMRNGLRFFTAPGHINPGSGGAR